MFFYRTWFPGNGYMKEYSKQADPVNPASCSPSRNGLHRLKITCSIPATLSPVPPYWNGLLLHFKQLCSTMMQIWLIQQKGMVHKNTVQCTCSHIYKIINPQPVTLFFLIFFPNLPLLFFHSLSLIWIMINVHDSLVCTHSITYVTKYLQRIHGLKHKHLT